MTFILVFTKLVRWCNNVNGETQNCDSTSSLFSFLGREEGKKKLFLKQSDVKVQTGLKCFMTGSSDRFLITWILLPCE